MSERITPVLLSGGSGTRLWPVSREARPKQLLTLLDERTMLQATAARVGDPERFNPPIVVASEAQADIVERQLAEAKMPPGSLILEPCGRNTAAAIALAALESPPDALLLVLPSDHAIADETAFRAAIDRGAPWAAQDWIVTFGIRARHAETGYGYIEQGDALGAQVFRAKAFVEKPDAETAAGFVRAGTHHWNGGIFLFRAAAMLAALEACVPDILAAVRAVLASARREEGRVCLGAAAFEAVRAQSIDHAVMEKAAKVAVVPVEMGWSDVGSWDAIADLAAPDVDGNLLEGDALAIDCGNCMLRSEGRLVAAVGVRDLVVIETRDAVLILPRGETQRVREVVEALRRRGHPSLKG